MRKGRKQAYQICSSRDRPAARPFAIGINCTKVHKLSNLVQKFESAAKEQSLTLPRLVIYPDEASGLVYDSVTQKWAPKEMSDKKDTSTLKNWHDEVAEIVLQVCNRGAWKGILVGGCCKTTPAHILELKKLLE
jgi:homocysteine S-methyltransferase